MSDHDPTERRPSRRAILQSGLLTATGAVVGGAGTAVALSDGEDDDGTESPTVTGRLLPYQFVPGGRFTVRENDVGWHPQRIDGAARTHVLEYAHAPSYRAFLFTAPDAALEGGRSFAFDGRRDSTVDAESGLVAVEVVPTERTNGG